MGNKMKYYSLRNILSKNALYNLIIGERSNGKTYSVLEHGLKKYCETDGEEQMAVIRRWDEDIKGKSGEKVWDAIVANGLVEKYTHGEWTGIKYKSRAWYFTKVGEDLEEVVSLDPFAHAFSISNAEHYKSTAYPRITTILFDEFLTRKYYLPNEFIEFMSVLSTIIRLRDNVKIFMCGNTVNKYSPYFAEMGLTHIKEMKKGDIDVYTYGDSGLTVAVEFSDSPSKNKPSDIYFAFNNPKLSMVTGKGDVWEIDIYPHCPVKYTDKHILFKYFIEFDNEMLQCEIICIDSSLFTYIHRKTTELKYPDKDLIYSSKFDHRPNWRRNILKPQNKMEQKISRLIQSDKVFYQDNEVGEIIRNYLNICRKGA